MVVKRLPSVRPGKGKASMYIAGAANTVPVSEPVQRQGPSNGTSTWHKGAMSKRFDGKEESTHVMTKTLTVSSQKRLASAHFMYPLQPAPITTKSTVTKEEELAAMAAMFQAQSANWEETQEKMSQLVSPFTGFCQRSSPMSNEHCLLFFFFPYVFALVSQCNPYLHQPSWHRVRTRWRQTTCPCASPGSSTPTVRSAFTS